MSFHKKNNNQKKQKQENERLIYGFHAVRAALQNKKRHIHKIWATENALKQISEEIDNNQHPKPIITDRKFLDKKLLQNTVHQGIVIETDPLEEFFLSDLLIQAQQTKNMTVVILDHVTDPHNIGAILRSMSAFGASYLIVHKRHTSPITGTVAKIATGAVEYIPVIRVQNLSDAVTELKLSGFNILGMDEHATDSIGDQNRHDKNVLIMGAEGKGMREKLKNSCDQRVRLPTMGPIQSLNVSVATGIALFSLHKEK